MQIVRSINDVYENSYPYRINTGLYDEQYLGYTNKSQNCCQITREIF